MKPVHVFSLAALTLGGALFGTAQAQDAAPVRTGPTAPELLEGKDVFAHWCAPCHAADPALAGTMALAAKYKGEIPAALEDRDDLSPVLVEYFVRNGVAWMPPFRKTEISDAELAALGAYLSAPKEQRGAHAERLYAEMVHKKEAGQ